MTTQRAFRSTALFVAIVSIFLCASLASRSSTETTRPVEFDARGASGVPKGTLLRQPIAAQLKALAALEGAIGAKLEARYNALTATPNHLFSYSAYLTPQSSRSAESIAREFLWRNRQVFRFSDEDLDNLKLRSRAYVPDIGTTILLFEQQVNNLPVYHGEVMVNVNRAGQIINVGGDSYPQLKVTNQQTLAPEQAITAAAAALALTNFEPQSLGTKQVLATFGDLAPEFIEAPTFRGASAADDEIVVTRIAFPMGDTARIAYRFSLTTDNIVWENIVDAETGEVLRRVKQTAFFGPAGGGQGVGRRATFRPDIQDTVEANNAAGSSAGKVFDGSPTVLSGRMGFGMSAAPGAQPTYAPESATVQNSGRGFKASFASARTQSALVYDAPFGQVLRGFPDALKPSPESPFGWFYLPTDSNGAEIITGNLNRASTRALGYAMADEARERNLAANSPVADKSQPFSASLTNLPSRVELFDRRVLSSVYESHYTEGNNVVVSDDHANDNHATHGIKGYSPTRQFNAGYFDFTNGYEYGRIDAGGSPFFPAGALNDVYPGTLALFYYVNLLHDYWYSIGFTESLWNMQQDNFGRGGAGADAVIAQVQDRVGTNDANTTYPPDGTAPRFEALLFTQNALRRSDGAFEFDVIAHEIFHVVSSRSVSKGSTGCLSPPEIGEAFGQAEGYSDYIACSMADDDATGEYVTGEFDKGIRRLPLTNYRWSYGAANGAVLARRDRGQADAGSPTRNFQVHDTGEIFSAILWDMRELMIVKNGGAFFDGARRLGSGASFFIGNRRVQSVDALHPIDYRAAFNTNDPATIVASQHIVRPGMIAAEIAERGNRKGPLATAVANGARLADTLMLRALQLSPCNPSFIDSRDTLLLADRELTGGENQAIIWRAFASHGAGFQASSSTTLTEETRQQAYLAVEDFTAPAGVTECEQLGPLAAPDFTARNLIANTVTITINDGLPARDAASYVISRSTSSEGPFVKIAEIPAANTTFRDTNGGAGLSRGETFYYQVRATRNPQCVSSSNTRKIKITTGVEIAPAVAPTFSGVEQVIDPVLCDRLVLSWSAAGSANPDADIAYDIYRVDRVDAGNGTEEPSFVPSPSNRIASGIRGTAFTDTSLATGRVYYYIVQARDLANGKIDADNAGNRVMKFNAPTSPAVTDAPVFARENFESDAANNRFTPPLVDSASEPNDGLPAFQRLANFNGLTAMMYAPDFDPAEIEFGAQSDMSAVIGPLNLSSSSMMEMDHFFATEAAFDGGVIEVALGAQVFDATPYPNNTTTFDVGNYIVEGGYNGRLDGVLVSGAMSSALQGRRAYTGTKALHHVRVALGTFAAGGANNPQGLPVFLRFRMTSDVTTNAGPNSGWYITNLVINNFAACSATQASVSARLVDRKGSQGGFIAEARRRREAEINLHCWQSATPRHTFRNLRRRDMKWNDCFEG